MLPPFIIEQIRQREEQERQNAPQPYLELPLRAPHGEPAEKPKDPERGVVIIDLLGE